MSGGGEHEEPGRAVVGGHQGVGSHCLIDNAGGFQKDLYWKVDFKLLKL